MTSIGREMAAEETEAKHTAWVPDHDGSLSTHSRSDSEDESAYETDEFSGVTGNDRELLLEEEEREKLLGTRKQDEGRSRVLGSPSHDENGGRRKFRRSRKSRADGKAGRDEKSELMYEMEEGGLKDDASSQSSSSTLDLGTTRLEQPLSKVGDGEVFSYDKLMNFLSVGSYYYTSRFSQR